MAQVQFKLSRPALALAEVPLIFISVVLSGIGLALIFERDCAHGRSR